MDNNQMYHWGIKGMRWGVRRFQNKDGTRTALGKKRERAKDDGEEAPKKKSIKDYSDDELRKMNERYRLENEYRKNLAAEESRKVSKGKKIVNEMLGKAGSNIGQQLVTYFVGQGVNMMVKDIVGKTSNKALKELLGNGGNIVNPKKGQKD